MLSFNAPDYHKVNGFDPIMINERFYGNKRHTDPPPLNQYCSQQKVNCLKI